jgi:4,5-DOPA dioxygenase extradiol
MGDPLPTLFVSHGAPDLVISKRPAASGLAGLRQALPRPSAIVVVSAHWEADPVTITGAEHPDTIHDFWGFPDPLYAVEYPAPGEPGLAQRVQARLQSAGIEAVIDLQRGRDHGAWSPLKLMYPEADIPAIQVSLPHSEAWQKCGDLGAALAPLRTEGVLIMGSGGSVHNLRALERQGRTAPWATSFEAWLRQTVETGELGLVSDPALLPTEFAQAHPTPEHFLPLLVAWGAGGGERPGRRIYEGFDYGNLGMSCFQFGAG